MTELVVPRRFCGPPSSGNGGWSAGALAEHVDAPVVSVSLLAPPPLDTPLRIEAADDARVASVDGSPVLRAEPATGDLPVVAWVPPAEARAAETSYAGLAAHPFPTCFSCGTGRDDGLRIFPGRVADQEGCARVAATWTPDASVADGLPATTWAALDCVGGWAGDLEERLMVLARMTARVDRLPEIGAEHVVVGLGRRTEGRKTFTASALYDADGALIGSAEHLWIAVDPAAFA
ncbi:hypothetical protein [Nocardioides sp. YIM 152315]|uniref:hypothetical protein n=1 Tax=Nocardioides sp. YIM 152315 TaxID=3031760 RepID=UPI0023D9D13B|nr:hypothetical protein [Nocardioides sp. YIM 152315]MDF1605945.1 hypothetical protein [Nocardioides sp. YIM 152315]